MSRQQKKKSKDTLPYIVPDSDAEHMCTIERQLLHLDHASPVQRVGQLPPLLPPIPRDVDNSSSRKSSNVHHKHVLPKSECKTKKHNRPKEVSAHVMPTGRDNNVHDSITSDSLEKEKKHSGELNKTKKRNITLSAHFPEHVEGKAQPVYIKRDAAEGTKTHKDGERNGIADKPLNGKLKKKYKKKEKFQKKFKDKTNASIIEKKQTRLLPINASLQARKWRHNLLDAPVLLPDINKSAAQYVYESYKTDSEGGYRSECDINECVEMEQEHLPRYQDDKELMKELRLDLSFLYENGLKSPEPEYMDISLRYSNSDSLSDGEYTPQLTYIRDEKCQDVLDSNVENIEYDAYTDYSSDFESLSDDEFEDVVSQTMIPRASVPKRFVRTKPG